MIRHDLRRGRNAEGLQGVERPIAARSQDGHIGRSWEPVRTNGFPTATDVTVLRSRGDGTFDTLETFRIAASPQIVPDHRVLSGDLNHDGLPDLVIRCAQDLVILLGTGGGKFAVKTLY